MKKLIISLFIVLFLSAACTTTYTKRVDGKEKEAYQIDISIGESEEVFKNEQSN